MRVTGVGHLYLETHDWARAVAFWESLGFTVEFATDHGSGALRAPDGGTYVFLAEQPRERPLGEAIYLSATEAADFPSGTDVKFAWEPTHWGTRVAVLRDPDGREIRVEAPG